MNKLDDLISYQDFKSIWTDCPCGIAVVGSDGNIRAINPAFEGITCLAENAVVGKSEASLDELVLLVLSSGVEYNRSRFECNAPELKAIHYFSAPLKGGNHNGLNASKAELLREPLTSIYGFAELLLSQNYDEETRRNLTTTLLEQAGLMLNMINSYFDETAE